MGQKVSFQVGFQEYTPDTKPLKKEIYPSIEKPKKENEDNELNERELAKAMQKKLGIDVIKKHSEMPMKMESFIIEAIIVEKLKHSGNGNEIPIEIAKAIHRKLIVQYGGHWCVITSKSWSLPESGYCLSTKNGTFIFLTYKKTYFTVCQSPPKRKTPDKPTNENEDEKERQSLKAAQKNLGITVERKYEKTVMPLKMQSFVIDAIIVEKLKHFGNCSETSIAIKVKMDDQYGSGWNVLITKPRQTALKFYTVPGCFIRLKYDFCNYTVFKSG